jgi:RimJ/RimL family protein N-acetyltransferase
MLADDKIYLRKLERSDLDRTWEWVNTDEIFSAIGIHVPVSKSAQQKWFDLLDAASDKIVFAICVKEDACHVGNVSLDNIDLRHRNARLSIFVAEALHRGHGIGSRALHLLARYAFDFLNLHRIYLKVTAEQGQLLDFYGRLGFEVEGRLREHEYIAGRYVDKTVLGLLRSDYRNITS